MRRGKVAEVDQDQGRPRASQEEFGPQRIHNVHAGGSDLVGIACKKPSKGGRTRGVQRFPFMASGQQLAIVSPIEDVHADVRHSGYQK